MEQQRVMNWWSSKSFESVECNYEVWVLLSEIF